jgi:hypothetical protein
MKLIFIFRINVFTYIIQRNLTPKKSTTNQNTGTAVLLPAPAATTQSSSTTSSTKVSTIVPPPPPPKIDIKNNVWIYDKIEYIPNIIILLTMFRNHYQQLEVKTIFNHRQLQLLSSLYLLLDG